jgi:hypothetical protein
MLMLEVQKALCPCSSQSLWCGYKAVEIPHNQATKMFQRNGKF